MRKFGFSFGLKFQHLEQNFWDSRQNWTNLLRFGPIVGRLGDTFGRIEVKFLDLGHLNSGLKFKNWDKLGKNLVGANFSGIRERFLCFNHLNPDLGKESMCEREREKGLGKH